MKGRYNNIYIYVIIALIFLTIMSYIKQVNEGFQEKAWYKTQWYKSDYFIIPLVATLVIIGPIIYLIYKKFLIPVNQTVLAPA